MNITRAEPTRLDVRDTEPRNRFETIMAAYDALAPGAAIELVVDHDPRCMYYTLEATRPQDSFSFDYLESGPEVWRVVVGRR
jgi:uncharacterized protein (DUF2249 family)